MPGISEIILKNKVTMSILVVLFLCVVALVRFVFPYPLITPSTPTPPPPGWFADWLQDPVCEPPCWQGITPGVTTMAETARILGEIPWIKITFGPESTYPKRNRQEIWWRYKQPSQVSGRAYSDDQGDITTSLSFDGILSTNLQGLVDIYGPPSDVFIPDCHAGSCRTKLYYLSTGMVIYLGALEPNWRNYIKVTPDQEVRGIGFFAPGEDGFRAAYPPYASSFPQKFSPWEGYIKYPVKW